MNVNRAFLSARYVCASTSKASMKVKLACKVSAHEVSNKPFSLAESFATVSKLFFVNEMESFNSWKCSFISFLDSL